MSIEELQAFELIPFLLKPWNNFSNLDTFRKLEMQMYNLSHNYELIINDIPLRYIPWGNRWKVKTNISTIVHVYENLTCGSWTKDGDKKIILHIRILWWQSYTKMTHCQYRSKIGNSEVLAVYIYKEHQNVQEDTSP